MIKWKTKKEKLSTQETEKGRIKREKIINDAQAMKRLCQGPDFQVYCKLLEEDKEGLTRTLLSEDLSRIMSHEQNVRLKARIHQIDKCLKKPNSLIWQMEHLTEYRDAIKAKTRVRQAHGNKIGGGQV